MRRTFRQVCRRSIPGTFAAAVCVLFLGAVGCGGGTSTAGAGGGSAGGAAATGGRSGAGGRTGTGGATGAGGRTGTGGATGAGGAPGAGGATGGGGAASACVPSCNGKTCGDDGCDGVCGACPAAQLCGASGTCAAPTATTTFTVDAGVGRTAISPAIYGVAFAEAKSVGVATIQRFGGDCASMYNWKTDSFNCGQDYIFANQALVGFGYPPYDLAGIPAGMTGTDWLVTFDKQHGVDTLMTVPMIGWVAKDSTSVGDSGGTNPTKDAVQVNPAYMQDWVAHLVATFGGAASGGVKYYQLDNEVDNWASMHADVHPHPASSNEVLTSIETYGAAIKAADPDAFVEVYCPALPASLLYSPADFKNIGSDQPFAPPALDPKTNNFSTWLLKQLAAYEAQHGTKVFDCLDMHYPTAGSNPVEDVRSLWDTTYDEASWLTQDAFGGPLYLLPRMQGWINANRPGTGICISEYQYYPPGASGAAADPSSGVAEADALGVFGKYGVKEATYWTTLLADNGDVSPTYNAFAMYRSYDGNGAHFGDVSVGATTKNVDLSIYAAVDSAAAPNTLWIMLINKTAAAANNQTLSIAGFAPGATAKAYQSIGTTSPHALADIAVANGSLTVSLPARSINLLVLSKG
jgi:hypothetical protein